MPYLDVPRPSVQIQVQVLDLAPLAKKLVDVFFAGFLVDVGDYDNPAFDAADCDSVGCGERFAVRATGWRVDFHFG